MWEERDKGGEMRGRGSTSLPFTIQKVFSFYFNHFELVVLFALESTF